MNIDIEADEMKKVFNLSTDNEVESLIRLLCRYATMCGQGMSYGIISNIVIMSKETWGDTSEAERVKWQAIAMSYKNEVGKLKEIIKNNL